jgi:hypothetical protein
MDGLTKGWVCGVTKKNGDWLGSSTGPLFREGATNMAGKEPIEALINL